MKIAAADAPEAGGALPFFIPFTKVDLAKREVYGAATLEVGDDQGEICDVEQSIPFIEALAKRCMAESGGRKVAPLREMHGLNAVGNVLEFDYDPTTRVLMARSKVTDDAALRKVADGTLCGYSFGGKKRPIGFDAQGRRKYIAKPNELSLVDMGSIPGSQITLIKAAGVVVLDDEGAQHQRPLITELAMAKAAADQKEKRAMDETLIKAAVNSALGLTDGQTLVAAIGGAIDERLSKASGEIQAGIDATVADLTKRLEASEARCAQLEEDMKKALGAPAPGQKLPALGLAPAGTRPAHAPAGDGFNLETATAFETIKHIHRTGRQTLDIHALPR